MVITVVDVKRFEMSLSYSVKHEVIQSVTDKIYEINSEALIINLPWDKVTGAELISALKYKPIEKLSDKNKPLKIMGGKRRPRIEACEIETKIEFSKERIKDIFFELAKASEYGNIIRGKGLVLKDGSEVIKFDYVLGDLTFKRYNSEGPGRICLIGMNLNKEKIEKLFR